MDGQAFRAFSGKADVGFPQKMRPTQEARTRRVKVKAGLDPQCGWQDRTNARTQALDIS
jgi:hypothetical protein